MLDWGIDLDILQLPLSLNRCSSRFLPVPVRGDILELFKVFRV